MKKIKIIILIACLSTLFMSCVTTPEKETQVVYIKEPLKDPLPHPEMPILDISEGDVTLETTMEQVILLNGAILKLQLLIEIYEREDRKLPEGYGNQKYQSMTLEQLKEEYKKLLGLTAATVEPTK